MRRDISKAKLHAELFWLSDSFYELANVSLYFQSICRQSQPLQIESNEGLRLLTTFICVFLLDWALFRCGQLASRYYDTVDAQLQAYNGLHSTNPDSRAPFKYTATDDLKAATNAVSLVWRSILLQAQRNAEAKPVLALFKDDGVFPMKEWFWVPNLSEYVKVKLLELTHARYSDLQGSDGSSAILQEQYVWEGLFMNYKKFLSNFLLYVLWSSKPHVPQPVPTTFRISSPSNSPYSWKYFLYCLQRPPQICFGFKTKFQRILLDSKIYLCYCYLFGKALFSMELYMGGI